MNLFFCVLSALAVGSQPQAPQTVSIHCEDICIFDDLPDFCCKMPPGLYKQWAKAQNKIAYQEARKRADDWLVRNPSVDTYVQDNDYNSSSGLKQSEGASPGGANVASSSTTDYNGRSIQRTFRSRDRWCGGPVVIFNPYTQGK